ncbi:MAG: transketolase, partial [Planctomycetes bacterium]|nr:transketolase [Planctomycetota bacterium]
WLYSQQAQDTPIKLGKVIWVAGHSGPETAEDSRTHFGIYSPGITQFFPRGQVIDIHPWEPNEVGPALLAALGTKAPIVALHLTRPGVELPDRKALGMGDFREAANGAYIIRDYDPSRPKEGCIFVRGTSCTSSLIELLKEGWFDGDGPNVKFVAAISHELFMLQDKSWRDEMITADDWADCTFITNNARQHMWLWAGNRASFDYAMCPDHDEHWRTGGSYDEIIEEAGLDKESLRRGIGRFANERESRMANCCVPAGM